jgi:hypothetical protein
MESNLGEPEKPNLLAENPLAMYYDPDDADGVTNEESVGQTDLGDM